MPMCRRGARVVGSTAMHATAAEALLLLTTVRSRRVNLRGCEGDVFDTCRSSYSVQVADQRSFAVRMIQVLLDQLGPILT
jgi:hypothetical protein